MTRMVFGARMKRYYVALPPTLATKYLYLFKEFLATIILTSILVLAIVVGRLALDNIGLLTITLIALLGLTLGVPYYWAMTILHPTRTLPKITPSDLGIAHWEDVRFLSSDGVPLKGWFISPSPASDAATLVFVHGLGSNRADLLKEAMMMVSQGYGALLFDLRNHGTSGGSISTLGFYEANDVRGAVLYLLSRPDVNPDRVGLVGHSMGGVAVLRAAARLPQIKAIVTESVFTSLEDNIVQGIIARTGLPPFPFAPFMVWLGERITGLRINQIRPIDDVTRIAPCPVLFVHGEQDTTVRVSNSVKLFEACHYPKGLYLIRHATHAELAATEPQEFFHRVSGFLNWAVRGIERRNAPRINVS
ncbi:MAG: alpha/beta fold hydrolase [Chloroflexi bacterium]|nr:alpha/beta fold hydrolase [Chloroflexota bacterium]